jgi:vacuole morphology and inheritance protein 14
LIKDIVSESAATYVSILHTSEEASTETDKETPDESVDLPTAFSLARFIPLLKERIFVINPFTRTFLVGWITLLDSIPDLELVSYLPEFLGGLFKFLSDPNRDVHVTTQGALERFLSEIKRISRIKKGIEESRKSRSDSKRKRSGSIDSENSVAPDAGGDDDSATAADDKDVSSDDDWVPGQDVHVNHKDILEILTANLDSPLGVYSTSSFFTVNFTNSLQKKIVYWNHFDGLWSSWTYVLRRYYLSRPKFLLIYYQPWPVV